jgi:glycosyltransferase involved in cell wall biosynthesis
MSNILIIADSITTFSGVANQTREIIKGLTDNGHIVTHIGAAQHARQLINYTLDNGKVIEIFTTERYDDVNLIFSLIKEKSIECLILVTDPHRYMEIWNNIRAIKSKVPIIYYNVWDTDLVGAGRHYNQYMYEGCDVLACISKQTENFCRTVTETLDKKPFICHVPHGQNAEVFKPIDNEELKNFKKQFFRGKEYDFAVLLNSRNQTRKHIPDLIMAFKNFTESLEKDKAEKCALVIHAEIASPNGTDLISICHNLAPQCHIYLDAQPFNEPTMALLYNSVDVVAAVSNAEGFGLSIHEAMLCGIPVMASVTGGLQDQIGFYDEEGEPMRFSKEFSSNAIGRYRNHASWSFPIFPTSRNVIGSPQTPYLYEDNCSIESIQEGIAYWYFTPKEERQRRGKKGRHFCLTEGYNNVCLAKTFNVLVDTTIANYKKQNTFRIY